MGTLEIVQIVFDFILASGLITSIFTLLKERKKEMKWKGKLLAIKELLDAGAIKIMPEQAEKVVQTILNDMDEKK